MKQKKNEKKSQKIIGVSIALIINEKGEILLTQRYNPKFASVHGKWQLPGGTIEYGEHPKETVIREIKEEVNLDIELLSHNPSIFTNTYPQNNTHVVLFTYPAKVTGGKLDVRGDEATQDAKWIQYESISYEECLPKVKEIIISMKEFIKAS